MTNKPIRAVIVDDEPLARRTIRSLLQDVEGAEVVAECSSGKQALEAIRNLKPDLLFLDIQMPEMNGFEVLDQMHPSSYPAIIFVTAYDQYALRAFDVHALDYLLKPFDDERFHKAVDRALDHIRLNHETQLGRKFLALLGDYRVHMAAEPSDKTHLLKRIAVKSHGRISFISVSEIDWVEAADQYVIIHVDRESHLIRESMNQMESQLPPEMFVRIHRSTVVNLRRIREMTSPRQGESQVVLQNGAVLKVSRNRKGPLQDALLASGTGTAGRISGG